MTAVVGLTKGDMWGRNCVRHTICGADVEVGDTLRIEHDKVLPRLTMLHAAHNLVVRVFCA